MQMKHTIPKTENFMQNRKIKHQRENTTAKKKILKRSYIYQNLQKACHNLKKKNSLFNQSYKKANDKNINTKTMQLNDETVVSFAQFRDFVPPRDFLLKNICKPFFDHIKGTYVKVSFYNGYAICKIVDIYYDEDYKYEYNKQPFLTDVYLKVQHGIDILKIPVNIISNSKITEEEFARSKINEDYNAIKNHVERIRKLFNRDVTKEEIKIYENEKKKSVCGLQKKVTIYTERLWVKIFENDKDRNYKLADEMYEVYKYLEGNSSKITSREINEIARKYNLKLIDDLDKTMVVVTMYN
ncbi:hypothetical protein EDEG_03315 [Edhazardia aedis USNM 41457]|uniref:Plus3 domain-containing protein n=1 Tax=Edhazardia aedis (strain USNM 41457) TaxID=1003232 RepID=J9DHZ5_EDHAE|nr:hypothetical protein EDEG_03315 [Edhazardia aedis USNM 41457]|eukprot:EJW02245.1 hypothetical protein EDEG_03315 [Edhazardia aedis USNM 41457]